jgi:hypothetical protein
MDVCCLNRPLDDSQQDRNKVESRSSPIYLSKMMTPLEINRLGYQALTEALGFDGMIRFYGSLI